MQEYTISKLVEYVDILNDISYGAFYRGMSNENYMLKSSLGRLYEKNKDKAYILSREKDEFRIFRSYVQQYGNYLAFTNLDLLALAQHYGMPTRLLDWTINPLVALYFAVKQDQHDNNAIVYILNTKSFVDDNFAIDDMLGSDKIAFNKPGETLGGNFKCYLAKYLSPRISAQHGIFTIHADPFEEIGSEAILKKIKISRDKCKSIYIDLYKIGVHEKSVFEDVSGLANWLKRTHLSED